MNAETIMIICPMKRADPTQYTYQWAQKAIKIATDLGYNVKVLEKDNVTYDKVSEAIKKYKPRMLASFSHGCPLSLQGQDSCVITKNMSLDKLFSMATCPNPDTRSDLLKILNPLGNLSCPGICNLDNDPCAPLCNFDTNVNLLKGTIVMAVACYSASKLGEYAIEYGADSYIGYDDLLMFPVDSINTQKLFGEVQLLTFKELLLGSTVQEAIEATNKLEDKYIRKYKHVKYTSLPFLWNKLHRKVLGNEYAMIYNNG